MTTMVKSEVLIWYSGKSEPEECPMVITHPENEYPEKLRLASFESPMVTPFKLIDLIYGGRRVYYESWSHL
jgi:hypothetical protein